MAAILSPNSERILAERYVDKEHDQTVEGMWDRLSMGNTDYKEMLENLLFLPNSPTMFNLGLPFGGTLSACFTADTVIHTLAGDFTVAELLARGDPEFEVFSTDGKRVKIGKAFGLRKTRTNAAVYRVIFDTGDEIKLTDDHLVMMRDGSYKPVKDLAVGDSVMPFNHDRRGGYRIIWQLIDRLPVAAYKWAFLQSEGRWARKGMHLHHRNFNKGDDRPSNLQEMTESDHARLHRSIDNPMHRPEVAAKISRHMMGNKRGVGPKPGTARAMVGNQHAKGNSFSRPQEFKDNLRGNQNARRNRFRLTTEQIERRTATRKANYNHKVVSIEYAGEEDVYDLSVHKYHNFAANGIFIHNCFVFDVTDSLLGDWPDGGMTEPWLTSILGTNFKAACVAKAGGGVGYYLGNIRPKGSPIRSTHKKACGPVTVLKYFQFLRSLITQGGKRDLAQMAVLNADHPDIREFIHCKDEDPQALSAFNISVSWKDKYLKQVDPSMLAGEGEWNKLWFEQCTSAWKTGCPGNLFWDTINQHNATPHLGDINATNPCGETPNLNDEPCNLGSLAVVRFLEGVGRSAKINWGRLKEYVRRAIRYMDDILDRNIFPHPAITKMALSTRKLGLGVMGWADLLALMHVPYDSQEAVNLGGELMSTINETALNESVRIAKEKGPYPAYEGGTPETKENFPWCRNSTRSSIAPTGTISMIAEVWGGIEPYFALNCERTTYEGIKMQDGVPNWVRQKLNGFADFQPKVASEIDWPWHVLHQAAFQRHTDLGVSKTINMPNTATIKDVSDAYRMMWETKCKGGTIFREGCRKEAVLVKTEKRSVYSVGEPAPAPAPSALPNEIPTVRKKFYIGGHKGYVHAGHLQGKVVEVFIRMANPGSTVDGMLNAWCINFSKALQRDEPLENMIKLNKNHRFDPAGFTGDKDIPSCTSIPDFIVRWLELRFQFNSVMTYTFPGEVIIDKNKVVDYLNGAGGKPAGTGEICPQCGTELIRAEGCLRCPDGRCGWTRC